MSISVSGQAVNGAEFSCEPLRFLDVGVSQKTPVTISADVSILNKFPSVPINIFRTLMLAELDDSRRNK